MKYQNSSPENTLGPFSEKIAQEILKQNICGQYYFDDKIKIMVEIYKNIVSFWKGNGFHREKYPAYYEKFTNYNEYVFYIDNQETNTNGPSYYQISSKTSKIIDYEYQMKNINYEKNNYFLIML